MPNKLARNIVAELLNRERFALRLFKESLRKKLALGEEAPPHLEHMISVRSAHWAEAHNAAETAKRVLWGHEIHVPKKNKLKYP